MAKPMTVFTTDLQHSGMIAKDLDETIKFYREVMGFELAGLFMNGENRCAFLRYGHLTIETWEGDPAPMTTGAINHEIQSIPSFWKHGIRYFNIYGPNGETIEFCQIVEE